MDIVVGGEESNKSNKEDFNFFQMLNHRKKILK